MGGLGHPDWTPAQTWLNGQLAPDIRRWLLYQGSLTERLVAISQGHFAVCRLHQGWGFANADEASLLEMGPRQAALIRETELRCNGQVAVFARSVFPAASLTGSLAYLKKLQNRSLGALLFRYSKMRRTPFEIARLSGDSNYLPQHLHQDQPAWGRRSRFVIDNKSMMVSEVFLQSFRPWRNDHSLQRSTRGKIVSLK